MKNYIIPICLSFVFSLLLVSCGKDGAGVEGVWSAQSAKIESSKFDATTSKLVEAEYAKTNIKFEPAGKAQLLRGMDLKQGIFVIDNASNTLKISNAEDDPILWSEEFTIKSQGANEMTLVSKIDEEGSTATLVMQKKQ